MTTSHDDDPAATRRGFLTALGALAAAGHLPEAQAARPRRAAPARVPLSRPASAMAASYDVVVIGSGYGGAVMAARLAAGRRLAVLERGREWMPADFPDTLAGALAQFRSSLVPLGLYDYRTGSTMDVFSGNGLGGTSLVNANVIVPADRDVFDTWPSAIRADVAGGKLDTWEARVRGVLAGDSITDNDALRKHWFHRSTTQARARAGAATSFAPLPLAVNLHKYDNVPNAQGVAQALCTHCGDCVSGCKVGAKNTLDVNYLPLAKAAGAEIYSRIEVDWLEHLADGRWRVHYISRPATGGTFTGTVDAGSVVLAAGSLGSTQILLRSRSHGVALSNALGTRFSANGDLLGFGYDVSVQTNSAGFGLGSPLDGEKRVGPTITAMADYRRGAPSLSQRYILEDGAVPRALVDAVRLAMPLSAGPFLDFLQQERETKDLLYLRSDGALNHAMVYLGIGHDSASGKVALDANGCAQVVWPGVTSEPFVARLRAEMGAHAATFGGRYVDYPRTNPLFGGALTTVHPLGGCPMSERAEDGVVNADGQVWNPSAGSTTPYANLRVVDGAIAPSSIGVNPLLTIAALAERAAERFH